MTLETTRRRFLVGTGLTAAAATIGLPAFAQDKPTLRFSAVFPEQDIRAEMMKMFADAIKGDFAFQGYYGGTHFKQDTKPAPLQRGSSEEPQAQPHAPMPT